MKDDVINLLLERIAKLEYEVERLNNIIKEVREYIENKLWNYFDERNSYLKVRDDILEIIEKENR